MAKFTLDEGMLDFLRSGGVGVKEIPSVELSEDQEKAMVAIRDRALNGNTGDEKGEYEVCLVGPAGTGKSTVSNELVKRLMGEGRKLLFAASTHKAAEVLASKIGRKVGTVHSVFGIKLKKQYGELVPFLGDDAHMPSNAIVLIDEASMVDEKVLELVRLSADMYGLSIIWIGDSYQLAPVGYDVSPVFENVVEQYVLSKVHRQADGNPLLDTATKMRKVLDGAPFPEIEFSHNEHGGIVKVTSVKEFLLDEVTKEDLLGDPCFKVLAFTNDKVNKYNNFIRRKFFDAPSWVPMEGEKWVTLSAMVADKEVLVPNNCDITILGASKEYEDEFGVTGCDVKFQANGEEFHWFLAKNQAEVKAATGQMFRKAKRLQAEYGKAPTKELDKDRREAWIAYYNADEKYLRASPGYAQTIHKSQGSTYANVLIDCNDIDKKCRDQDMKARLMYVALTRPEKVAYIYGSVHGLNN